MMYWIARGGQKHGPYALEDVRQMVGAGSVLPSDLAWKEGMSSWQSVAHLVAAHATPAALEPYPHARMAAMHGHHSPPLDLHWGLVLLFSFFTAGLFSVVWIFIEASYVKRLDPRTNAMTLLIAWVVLGFVFWVPVLGPLAWVAAVVCYFCAAFAMRQSLEMYYNTVEPIGLRLSGVMTFFFSTLYFQHHLSRIARWKRTGILTPQ